jgi:hypothetical protein
MAGEAPAPPPAPPSALDGKKAGAASEVPPARNSQAAGPGKKTILIGTLAATLLGTVAAIALWVGRPTHPSVPSASPSTIQSAVSNETKLSEDLAAGMDGLIAAAAKVNRPRDEMTNLTDAKAKIVALASALKDGASADALAPVNEMARDISKKETTLLARNMKRQWKDLEEPPATDDPNAAKAVAALQSAKADMDGRLTTDFTNLDAAHAIEAARQALLSFGQFQGTYGDAAPVYIAARQKEFATLYSSIQAQSDQIVALANVPKPWFLASQARKQAYQLRQDNAVQAKALLAPLSALSGTTADLSQLNAAIAQLSATQKSVSDLYAASNAATL